MGIHQSSRKAAAAVLGAVTLAAGLSACGSSPSSSPQPTAASPSVAATTVRGDSAGPATTPTPPTNALAAAAWEALMAPTGEYAASASYAAVIDAFGPVEPYASIRAAEERHIDALVRQLQRFGVTPPPNPYLGTAKAPPSLAVAAQAWADGEVANIALYDKLMSAAANDQGLTRVFTNLRRASAEMHLPAFRAAAASGGTLTAAQLAELGLH